MKSIQKISLTFIFLLLTGPLATLALAESLKIGYVEFPPMTYTDENGQPAGSILDIATKTLDKAGLEWSAISLPANRMADMLVEGKIHLWVGLPTMSQFKENTLVSDSIVDQLILRAYSIGKKPPIHKAVDLKGKTLLILRGYSYGGWTSFIKDPANKIKYLEFDTHEKAFKRLAILSERIEEIYLLNYKHPSDDALKKLDLKNIHFNQISALDMHFVVTKKMVGARAILEQIEEAFLQLKKSGAF